MLLRIWFTWTDVSEPLLRGRLFRLKVTTHTLFVSLERRVILPERSPIEDDPVSRGCFAYLTWFPAKKHRYLVYNQRSLEND